MVRTTLASCSTHFPPSSRAWLDRDPGVSPIHAAADKCKLVVSSNVNVSAYGSEGHKSEMGLPGPKSIR